MKITLYKIKEMKNTDKYNADIHAQGDMAELLTREGYIFRVLEEGEDLYYTAMVSQDNGSTWELVYINVWENEDAEVIEYRLCSNLDEAENSMLAYYERVNGELKNYPLDNDGVPIINVASGASNESLEAMEKDATTIEVAQLLYMAWTHKGSHPDYHDKQIERLRREWSTLYNYMVMLEKTISAK